MKKLFWTLSLVGVLGVFPTPVPADATVAVDCLNEAIASCDADFGGNNDRSIAVRGWCYIIRWGWCSWLDE